MQNLKKILRAINPVTWYKAWRESKRLKQQLSVSDFAHKHKHLVVIVLDPADDSLYMAYKDVQVLNKIKTADGKNHKIVKGVMSAGGQFKTKIDFFLTSMLEILKVPLNNPFMQQLVHWFDGAAFVIGKKLKDDKINAEFASFVDKNKEKFGAKEIAQGLKGRVGGDLDIRVNGEKI